MHDLLSLSVASALSFTPGGYRRSRGTTLPAIG
jgi:hypothetical protein